MADNRTKVVVCLDSTNTGLRQKCLAGRLFELALEVEGASVSFINSPTQGTVVVMNGFTSQEIVAFNGKLPTKKAKRWQTYPKQGDFSFLSIDELVAMLPKK